MPENASCSSASTCGRSSCEGCPSKEKTSMLEEMNAYSNVKHVIGVVSGKGGVGKSFVTSSLASMMAKAGYKVGILDADITGPSIPKMYGIHERAMGTEAGMLPAIAMDDTKIMSINLLLEEEESPVIWRGPVIAGTVKQFWTDVVWGDIDVMIIDMPPGTGDVPLTVFQSIPVDGIVIVTSPQELVSMIVEKAAKMTELMDINVIGAVENMSYAVCPDCGKKIEIYGKSHIEEIAEKNNIPVYSRIPFEPNLASLCDKGMIEMYDGDWIKNIVSEIIE